MHSRAKIDFALSSNSFNCSAEGEGFAGVLIGIGIIAILGSVAYGMKKAADGLTPEVFEQLVRRRNAASEQL